MSRTVTVALPVLNGGPLLGEVLGAVRRQRIDADVELVVADSGSTDGSRELAARHGAEVIAIAREEFSHGGTRNLLAERASGSRVAFLTQDAVPASEHWLARLVAAFEREPDVALAYGPYIPRPDASHMVRRELTEMFGPEPRVDRGPPPARPGPVTFLTDANGCVDRAAWERVPFREVPYAEDQMLARDMLAAGYAKAYVPDAGVVHSHDYPPLARFRRFFDEFRGLREVYGHVEEVGPRYTPAAIRRHVARDRAFLRREGASGRELDAATLESLRFYALRAAGAALGSRADRLPPAVRGWFSLEGRSTFEPVAPAKPLGDGAV